MGCNRCDGIMLNESYNRMVYHCPTDKDSTLHPDAFDLCVHAECMNDHWNRVCYEMIMKNKILDLLKNLNKTVTFLIHHIL